MITSKNNEIVKKICKLQQKKFRQQEGKYLISKPNIINEAKTLGIEFYLISCIDESADLFVSKDVMQKITNDDFDEAIVCEVLDSSVDMESNVLVIDGVNDPGNMGTILRTALAFGIKNVVVSNESVDIYNPKVISAMQGCHFHQNIKVMDLVDFFESTENKNIMTFLDEPKNFDQIDFENFNLVVGNEGNGISKEYKKYMDYNYLIDIEFESLNVAIAAGIIMHDLTRG